MATKLIAYDLNAPGQNYSSLTEAIKALGPWWHHLDSTWLVNSALTPTQICNHLSTFIDGGDELLVVDVTGRSRAWRGFTDCASRWLKDTWS